jgi:choline transport protein
MILNNENYVPERWHVTLILIALVTLCQIFNTFFAHRLPLVESGALVLHLAGFLAILIPLWALGEPGNTKEVFTTFTDGGGCKSPNLQKLITWLN